MIAVSAGAVSSSAKVNFSLGIGVLPRFIWLDGGNLLIELEPFVRAEIYNNVDPFDAVFGFFDTGVRGLPKLLCGRDPVAGACTLIF